MEFNSMNLIDHDYIHKVKKHVSLILTIISIE